MRLPAAALGQVAGKALLKYAEVKAVVGGVTAIQGSTKLSRPYEGWLIRNVEFETFGSRQRSVFQSVRTLAGEAAFADARAHMTAGRAFIYHLAEGTAPSLVGEYTDLKDNDCLHPGLVAIHATALGRPEYAEWGPHGSSMVWSPLSNLWLYRRTSQVTDARDHGIRVCLGADWGPSGSKNLLGELKVADLWNRRPAADGGLDGAHHLAGGVAQPGRLLGVLLPGPVMAEPPVAGERPVPGPERSERRPVPEMLPVHGHPSSVSVSTS